MLTTKRDDIAPQSEFYSDSLLQTPSMGKSAIDNFSMAFATPFVMLEALNGTLNKKPEGQAILNSFKQIQLEAQTPGMGWQQYLQNEGSGLLGFALNPINWGFGEAGALAARGVSRGVESVLPNAALMYARKPIKEILGKIFGKYVPENVVENFGKNKIEKTLSASLIANKALNAFSIFSGAGIPQAIVENYKADTNHIEWAGVAKDAANMGIFGLKIAAIPFAWGILRGKLNRGKGENPTQAMDATAIDTALAKGHITPDEHQWLKDYYEFEKNPANKELEIDLKERATRLIKDNNYKADTVSNEALLEILTQDDINNLKGPIADQLASLHLPDEQRTALTDFIIHNRLDELKKDPAKLDGVRGYVDFLEKKMQGKDQKIAEYDSILKQYLLKSVKENMPFSQKELFKLLRKMGYEASHVKNVPMTIPNNIVRRIKLLSNIKRLKAKLAKEKRRGFSPNKKTLNRIAELEKKLPKILTPKEELLHLTKKLLIDGLPKNFVNSEDYHRLLDLSNAWHNARSLLDRVHLEHEYNKQEAFLKVAKELLHIADSNFGDLAKPENVMEYLKNRLESNLEKPVNVSDVNQVLSEIEKAPIGDALTQALRDQEAAMNDVPNNESKKAYQAAAQKLKEFSEKQTVFANAIKCQQGVKNA